jgi:hypothetical protein
MGKPKVGERRNEFKYGMALYGVAWPEGPYYFVCGGGGHGLQNRWVADSEAAGGGPDWLCWSCSTLANTTASDRLAFVVPLSSKKQGLWEFLGV